MAWRFSDDVEPYAAAVLPLLREDPAAYSLGLTVIETLRAGHRFSDEPMLFGWREEGDGAISRTPPFDVLLSVVPDADELAAALRGHGIEVPGVNGDVDTVERFVAAWGEPSEVVFRLRRFVLGELEPPDPAPPGAARPATPDDAAPATRWFDAFTDELDLPDRIPESRTRQYAADGLLWLWEADGEAVALALRTAPAAGVARVICVYTPPEQRGRRFGGAPSRARASRT